MIVKIRTADLEQGMFLEKVDSGWLTSPWGLARKKIDSIDDIEKLRQYNISHVFIDTSKGVGVPRFSDKKASDRKSFTSFGMENTFEVHLNELWFNRPSPVDLYRVVDGEHELALRKGLVFSHVVAELLSSGVATPFRVPLDQKFVFKKHNKTLALIKEKQKTKGFDGEFIDPKKVAEYLEFMSSFHAVNRNALIPGVKVNFDVFTHSVDSMEKYATLALSKGERINVDHLNEWKEKEVYVFIQKEYADAYRVYLNDNYGGVEEKTVQATMILETARVAIEKLAANPLSAQITHNIKNVVIYLDRILADDLDFALSVIKFDHFNYDFFTHSVNVAALSLALGRVSGITNKEHLLDLGLGAIIHDLGKYRIPSQVLNKPGKLLSIEYDLVKKHVQLGYEMLKDNPAIPKRAFLPLLQHHEKLKGDGYPMGLSGENVNIDGRIVGIIDVFDALTTRRPYREAMPPFDAMMLISKDMDNFDKGLFAHFINMVSRNTNRNAAS